jgi:hypothetical protein
MLSAASGDADRAVELKSLRAVALKTLAEPCGGVVDVYSTVRWADNARRMIVFRDSLQPTSNWLNGQFCSACAGVTSSHVSVVRR